MKQPEDIFNHFREQEFMEDDLSREMWDMLNEWTEHQANKTLYQRTRERRCFLDMRDRRYDKEYDELNAENNECRQETKLARAQEQYKANRKAKKKVNKNVNR